MLHLANSYQGDDSCCLFTPRRKRFVEGTFARGALLDSYDGPTLVDVDQRYVEPRPLFKRLQVARAVGAAVRQPDKKEPTGPLPGDPRQWRAARLFVGLHQDAGHVADPGAREVRR